MTKQQQSFTLISGRQYGSGGGGTIELPPSVLNVCKEDRHSRAWMPMWSTATAEGCGTATRNGWL